MVSMCCPPALIMSRGWRQSPATSVRPVALQRIGKLVHYLDVGGHQPPEAAGVECVLMGLRESHSDDDQLLLAASAVFDSLYTSYTKEN